MHIMIVEDEYPVALDLERTLRLAGYETIGPAATADTAYALIREQKPDLALVDICLADGDTGPVIARDLWDQHRVPSLFMAASLAACAAYTDAALGALTKPVSSLTLFRSVNVVRRIVRGEPLRKQDVPAELRLFGSW